MNNLPISSAQMKILQELYCKLTVNFYKPLEGNDLMFYYDVKYHFLYGKFCRYFKKHHDVQNLLQDLFLKMDRAVVYGLSTHSQRISLTYTMSQVMVWYLPAMIRDSRLRMYNNFWDDLKRKRDLKFIFKIIRHFFKLLFKRDHTLKSYSRLPVNDDYIFEKVCGETKESFHKKNPCNLPEFN